MNEEKMADSGVPPEYIDFRDRTRIHLKQILNLDRHTEKVPIHAVALLVMVAYETLGKFTELPPDVTTRSAAWLFARRHRDWYQIEESVGRRIFRALRNGLAHRYGHYRVPVDGLSEVRLILTWKGGPHLRAVAVARVGLHNQIYPLQKGPVKAHAVCVDVDSLWFDLDRLFSEVSVRLEYNRSAAASYRALFAENAEDEAKALRDKKPSGWRKLLKSRRWEADE